MLNVTEAKVNGNTVYSGTAVGTNCNQTASLSLTDCAVQYGQLATRFAEDSTDCLQ